MIIDPPGEPTVGSVCPPCVTSVGAIELRGRFATTLFGWCRKRVVEVGQLVVEQEPPAGDDEPEPPVDSIVNVYETTFPQRSETLRCVVESPSWSADALASSRARAPSSSHQVAGRDGARRGGFLDQRPPRRRECVEEPAAGRPRSPRRPDRRPGRRTSSVSFEEQVQLALARLAGERIALEDVERLADGRAAARRRPHSVDVEAPGTTRASAPARAPRTCASRSSSSSPGRQTLFAVDQDRPGATPFRRARPRSARAVGASRRGAQSARTRVQDQGCGRRCRRPSASRRGRGRARPTTRSSKKSTFP